MVGKSTSFFFPAVILLIILPLAPLRLNWPVIGPPMLFLVISYRLCRRLTLRRLLLVCLFLLTLLVIRNQRFTRLQLAQSLNFPVQEYLDLHGTVASQIQPLPEKGFSFMLRSHSIQYRRRKHALALNFQVRLRQGPLPEGFARGAEVAIAAALSPPRERYNFHMANGTARLLASGTDWLASCKSAHMIEVVSPAPSHWRLLQTWREAMDRAVDRLPVPARNDTLTKLIMKSSFLGYPYTGEPDIYHGFMVSGGLHLLAISGSHIALITAFTLFLFSWLPPNLRRWLCAVVILLYLLQAAAPVSAQRSAIVAWAWLWASHRQRKMHFTHILGLSGCLDLACNPLIVFSAGFFLTYAICFALAYWADWLGLSPQAQPRPLRTRIATLLKTQGLAILTSTPLTLHFFNNATLNALPAGMLMIPLFSLLLPVAAACLLLFMFIPASAGVSLFLLNPLVSLLQTTLAFFSHWDCLLFYRQAPSIGLILVYLALLLGCGPLLGRKQPIRIGLLPLLAVFVFLLLPDRPYRPSRTELHTPDIGQGEIHALIFPSGKSMLIDCGGSPFSDQRSATQLVSSYLLNNRIHPQWIAVSHFHSDHCGTLPELIRIFAPRQILHSECPQDNPLFNQSRKASTKRTQWLPIKKGDSLTIDGTRLHWLYPERIAPAAAETENGHSQVIHVQTPDFTILLCGDIGSREESRLLASVPEIDILKVPHHGSKGSSSMDFLKTVSPKLALFHCDRHNPFHFPHPTVLDRYRQLGIPCRFTWQGGLIISGIHSRIRLRLASKTLIPAFEPLVPDRAAILDF